MPRFRWVAFILPLSLAAAATGDAEAQLTQEGPSAPSAGAPEAQGGSAGGTIGKEPIAVRRPAAGGGACSERHQPALNRRALDMDARMLERHL
jgi:hypothetical protein